MFGEKEIRYGWASKLVWEDDVHREIKTVGQVVAEIAGLMPQAVSTDTLAEYGIEASREQAQRITLEVLYLNLFWIFSACDDLLTKSEGARLHEELSRTLTASWASGLQLEAAHRDIFAAELDGRHREYAAVIKSGGNPGSLCVEAAGIMERGKVIPPEDRTKMVALLVDMTPVETYVEALRDIHVVEG